MIRLFPYYGSKIRAAAKYPAPPKDWTIVEPFAGAAGYSCRYPDRDVHLYDADPVVCAVINYLIRSTHADIMKLPLLKDKQLVGGLDIEQDAKWMIGFWLNSGSIAPKNMLSAWGRDSQDNMPANFWGERCRARLAKAVEQINHWTCTNASYKDIKTMNFDPYETVWFVDPPYIGRAGNRYVTRFREYDDLAAWCRNRSGRVIVCEQAGATWMPFAYHSQHVGARTDASVRQRSTEVVWLNERWGLL